MIVLFSGLMFFNLNFFQLELTSLHLAQKNRQVYENILKIMSGIDEEEGDCGGEGGSESCHSKEVDLFWASLENTLEVSYVLVTTDYDIHHDRHPLSGCLETIIQPPEG